MPTQLIVFADDWGRHPSSSQHLVRELLPQYPTLWVNTVGTRRPKLGLQDAQRIGGVLKRWAGRTNTDAQQLPAGLSICSPMMYPGYRRPWQRRINAKQVANAVNTKIDPAHRRVAVTTLPTTADLVGKLDVDRWVYYCVDDYSKWPGTDHAVMDAMERELVGKVGAVVCVSETLRERVAGMGREDATLLKHGVDLEMWLNPDPATVISKRWPEANAEFGTALFWGLIDARMDLDWVDAIDINTTRALYAGRLVDNNPSYYVSATARLLGMVAHHDLPAYAAKADVLIMPYIDAPVTRAMQPLKLLEYLATMKPVVVRDLPSTRAWADCCDLGSDAETFAKLVVERAKTGTPPAQIEARKRRLAGESWSAKAAQLAGIIND